MKVLHLQTELNKTCGITKTIFLICKHVSSDIQHCVFTLGGDNIEHFINNNIRVTLCCSRKYSLTGLPKIINQIIKICREENINILHSHHRYFDLLAFFVQKFLKIKTITSVHSKVFGKKLFSYKANILIAVGETIKNHLIKYFGIDENRITVINNFVETQFSMPTDSNNVGTLIPPDQKIVLFIGRFSKEKGIDILLKAVHRLQAVREKIFLLLIGTGEESDFVNEYIKSNHVNALVLLPQDEITQYYYLADIVILPSRVDPFPLVMLEAGLMSKPFIGSNVDGISEFIDNDYDGILVPPENVDELVNSIRTLAGESEKSKIYGERLHSKVENKFTEKKIIPLYNDLYHKIISGQ